MDNLSSFSFEDVEFDNTGNAGVNGGIIGGLSGSALTDTYLKNCKFTNFTIGSQLFGLNYSNSSYISLENPELNNVTKIGPTIYAAYQGRTYNAVASIFSQTGDRTFYIENMFGRVSWISTMTYPTLDALLPDGVTNWSLCIAPTTTANKFVFSNPLVSPRIVKINSLADGARTFKIQFCISDALAFTKRDISITVVYKDVNGDFVSLDTWDNDSGALTGSSVTWSAESGGKVVYSDGGALLHNKYELEIATPVGKNLPEGEEVGVYFNVHTAVSNATQYIFVNPDVSIV
jgi:hypothetical protein